MKNLKFFLGLTFIMAVFHTATAQTTAKQSSVSFGRFGSDCASGRGACSFNAQKNLATSSTFNSAEKTSASTIVLNIKRTNITAQDELRIAGKPFSEIRTGEALNFQQVDAILLDKSTTENLGVQSTFNKILAGNYPMIIYNDRVEITFNLSN